MVELELSFIFRYILEFIQFFRQFFMAQALFLVLIFELQQVFQLQSI